MHPAQPMSISETAPEVTKERLRPTDPQIVVGTVSSTRCFEVHRLERDLDAPADVHGHRPRVRHLVRVVARVIRRRHGSILAVQISSEYCHQPSTNKSLSQPTPTIPWRPGDLTTVEFHTPISTAIRVQGHQQYRY